MEAITVNVGPDYYPGFVESPGFGISGSGGHPGRDPLYRMGVAMKPRAPKSMSPTMCPLLFRRKIRV